MEHLLNEGFGPHQPTGESPSPLKDGELHLNTMKPEIGNQENDEGVGEDDLTETWTKLKIMTDKFKRTKSELEETKKENKELHNEVISLQNNIRNMVPGISCCGSSFPLFNELQNEVSEFLKCDCMDSFFDLLCPELNLDGVVYFYKHVFGPITKHL